jgi:hypothetical protein
MEGFDNFGEDDEVKISLGLKEGWGFAPPESWVGGPMKVIKPGQSPLDEIDIVTGRVRKWLTYGAIAAAAAAAIYFVLRMGGVL